jgi:hypothetical protein
MTKEESNKQVSPASIYRVWTSHVVALSIVIMDEFQEPIDVSRTIISDHLSIMSDVQKSWQPINREIVAHQPILITM